MPDKSQARQDMLQFTEDDDPKIRESVNRILYPVSIDPNPNESQTVKERPVADLGNDQNNSTEKHEISDDEASKRIMGLHTESNVYKSIDKYINFMETNEANMLNTIKNMKKNGVQDIDKYNEYIVNYLKISNTGAKPIHDEIHNIKDLVERKKLEDLFKKYRSSIKSQRDIIKEIIEHIHDEENFKTKIDDFSNKVASDKTPLKKNC